MITAIVFKSESEAGALYEDRFALDGASGESLVGVCQAFVAAVVDVTADAKLLVGEAERRLTLIAESDNKDAYNALFDQLERSRSYLSGNVTVLLESTPGEETRTVIFAKYEKGLKALVDHTIDQLSLNTELKKIKVTRALAHELSFLNNDVKLASFSYGEVDEMSPYDRVKAKTPAATGVIETDDDLDILGDTEQAEATPKARRKSSRK